MISEKRKYLLSFDLINEKCLILIANQILYWRVSNHQIVCYPLLCWLSASTQCQVNFLSHNFMNFFNVKFISKDFFYLELFQLKRVQFSSLFVTYKKKETNLDLWKSKTLRLSSYLFSFCF